MGIVKREVWQSPDGQFHETEEDAVRYVERGEINRAIRGTLIAAEACDSDDVGLVADVLMQHFNITKKEG